mgnify:CR=1 FL=1
MAIKVSTSDMVLDIIKAIIIATIAYIAIRAILSLL